MSNSTNAVRIPKRTTTNGWAIYSKDSGEMMYFGMSRNSARDFKNNYTGSDNPSGARKVNATVTLSS